MDWMGIKVLTSAWAGGKAGDKYGYNMRLLWAPD